MWKKLKLKLRQLLCSHYGPQGVPVCDGYNFFVNEKTCHICGAKVRQRTTLEVVPKGAIPFHEKISFRD